MRPTILALSILLLATCIPSPAAALTDPNPSLPEWIESTLRIAQPDITTLEITGDIVIHKYVLNGTSYRTSDDLGSAYQQTVQADNVAVSQGQTAHRANDFVNDLSGVTARGLNDSLRRAFPTASVNVLSSVVDRSTLAAPGGDPYLPGVKIAVSAKVVRSLSDLGLGGLGLPAVRAAFLSGAVITTDLSLSANAGHDVTYILTAPADPTGTVFRSVEPTTGATLSGGELVIRIDNKAGATAANATYKVRLADPASVLRAPDAENLSQTITITLAKPTKGSDKLPIDVKVEAAISAIDVAKRFGSSLPAALDLTYLSADGFRALHEAGAISDASLDKASDDLVGSIRENLTAALGDAGTVHGEFVENDLHLPPATPYSTTPPLRYVANATATYTIPGEHAKDADVALDIGAIVNFDVNLFSSARDTTFILRPATGIVFTSTSAGTLASDGRSISIDVPAGAASPKAKVGMRATDAPQYTAQKADIGVVVDLKDLDITIGKATKGDLGNLVVQVSITGNLGVIQVPDDLKASLGDSLTLDYLSSDAIRLLKARGLLNDKTLADLESNLLKKVGENLAGSMGGPVKVTGGLDAATLDAATSTPLSGDKPVVFHATASFAKPLSGGGAPVDMQALALYTVSQSFDLPKVQGLDTGYTVILPKGLAVGSVSAEGGEAKQGRSADGRDQFTVTPGSNGPTKATVAIAVTPTFVMAKFWPVVLIAVLVIVLIVGTPIALVVRARSKKAASKK